MSSTRALQTVCAGLLVLAGALAGCGSGSGGGGGTPPPPSVTTTALADGANAVAYNQSLTASGGSGTLTWSVASGQLPTGLSLSSSGALTGTPTATGVFNFTVQVQDSANPPRTATAALSIRVVTSFVTITNNFFADGITTAAYNQTATATGGASSFTWDISAGALPAGLSISAAGAITGTPTAAGTANFTLRVRDAAGPLQQTVTKALSIRIADQLAIVTASLPDGINGNAYSQTLQASGGNGPFTWSTTAGVLPTGLALSSAGVITGNPGANGTFSFTVRAQDSSNPQQSVTRALSIRVNPLLSVTTSSLPNGTTGTFYNQILVADGGLGSFTWSLATGTLPAGLTLSSAGIISGIPTTAATSNFTVQVGDSSAPPQTATKSLGITIAAAVMNITTSSLPSGVVNASYKVQLAVLGGQMPISWLPVSGTLPVGFTLFASTGEIVGTTTTPGTFNFTVQATDATLPTPNTALRALTITISAALGRNDTPATATPLSNGTFTASISPIDNPPGTAAPDIDVYRLNVNGSTVVVIEIFALRLTPSSLLDSVIEIVDGNGIRFSTCRAAGSGALFTSPCLNDDQAPGLLDSKIEFQAPPGPAINVFVRVLDWAGNARPDLIYQVVISGAN